MKLNNKLNKKLNKKLVSLLLIIMVTLTAIFIASCAEKATTSGGTTGSGGGITGGPIKTCADSPLAAANSGNFISKWNVSIDTGSGANKIKLPLVGNGNYNFTVDWGDCTDDATITAWDSTGADHTHTYTPAAITANGDSTIFTVAITGNTASSDDIKGWRFGKDTSDAKKLVEISSFGPLDLGATEGYQFRGAENLTITATDAPTLTSTKNLSYAFQNAENFNSDISKWNVSTVENMEGMFLSAENFNQDLSGWQRNGSTLASVTRMANMFQGAIDFNNGGKPLTWDVSLVDNMSFMFSSAKAFDQPIGTWNVSAVENMSYMFYDAEKFNADISSWNVSAVKNMSYMFYDAEKFNQNLNNWQRNENLAVNPPISASTLVNVANMNSMFQGASIFNNDDVELATWRLNTGVTCVNMFTGGHISMATRGSGNNRIPEVNGCPN